MLLLPAALLAAASVRAGTNHSPGSLFPSYEGRVMCGYQGWFRAEGDGSDNGWEHFGRGGKFDPKNCVIDYWPEVSEYAKTYPTGFKARDGRPARVFSPWDASTLDTHFRWMREYGIDGVFMQRFYRVTRTPENRAEGRVVLENALKASQKYQRAIAVMYDLSGLETNENCDSIIQDWKELVDGLKITSQGTNQTYLYHRGKPLVAIWGLGFESRAYDIHKIGIEKLLDFLKNDPQYGGCSILLGVPTYFRELGSDTTHDPYLHEIMAKADVILPWMVGRFRVTSPFQDGVNDYASQVKDDLAWCAQRNLDYAPVVFPGFSWYNLKSRADGKHDLDLKKHKPVLGDVPRLRGKFYWSLMTAAMQSGAKMIYVAMFDEMNEGTAILKCSNLPPANQPPAKFLTYEGLRTDHYLWLTGMAGKMLRHEIPLNEKLYLNVNHTPQTNAIK